jgi:hypothetical protein
MNGFINSYKNRFLVRFVAMGFVLNAILRLVDRRAQFLLPQLPRRGCHQTHAAEVK